MGNNQLTCGNDKIVRCLNEKPIDFSEVKTGQQRGELRGCLNPIAMSILTPDQRALLQACADNSLETLKLILSRGGDCSVCDANGTSALHVAARSGGVEVIRELLHHSCAVNAVDCAGWTPLHVAAYHRRADIVKVLLGNGAKESVANTLEETPFELARDKPTRLAFIEHWLAGNQLPTTSVNPDLAQKSRRLFNLNPYKAVNFILAIGLAKKEPQDIADFLWDLEDLSPVKLGEWLGEPDSFHLATLAAYTGRFDFSRDEVLTALRRFLGRVQLPMSGVKASQLLKAFAEQYAVQHPEFADARVIFSLSMALTQLDVAAHSATALTEVEFLASAAEFTEGTHFTEDFLKLQFAELQDSPLPCELSCSPEPFLQDTVEVSYKLGKSWKHGRCAVSDGLLWFFGDSSSPEAFVQLKHWMSAVSEGYVTLTSLEVFYVIKLRETGQVRIRIAKELVFAGAEALLKKLAN